MEMREGRLMLRAIRLPLALGCGLACAVAAAPGARAADSRDLGDIESAESREAGEPTPPGPAESAARWEPPSCDEVAEQPVDAPPADDREGWSSLLAAARARVDKAQGNLADLDAEYTYARNRQWPRGEALAKIVADREAARTEYANARCALPALVEKARRAGVDAEIWRAYPASID